MRVNPAKEKLGRGEPVFGTWLSMGDLYATRILARLGFDWLTLDMEHSAIDWAQATTIFAAVADAGCVPLARVPEGNHHYIKRVLDAGAWGIVVPMVNTVEQARTIIAAAKYPPVGNRSVGGGMHSMNFSATAGDYYEQANDQVWRQAQVRLSKGSQQFKLAVPTAATGSCFVRIFAEGEKRYALGACPVFINPQESNPGDSR